MQIPCSSIQSEESLAKHPTEVVSSNDLGQRCAGPSTTDVHPTPRTSTASLEHAATNVSQSASSSDEWTSDSRELNVKYWFADNGRINMKVQRYSTWLDEVASSQVSDNAPLSQQVPGDDPPPYLEGTGGKGLSIDAGPALNLVMHVVGSMDEASYFIAIARLLRSEYGHRVRIATHPEFKEEVEQNGVEFFDIGTPVCALDLFMGGPGARTLEIDGGPADQEHVYTRNGVIRSLMDHFWRACIEPSQDGSAFIADAIIANPQSWAHLHCAEKLGVPLHFMSTIPCTTSRDVAHPLVDIVASETGPQIANRLSYSIAEVVAWRIIGPCVNDFRKNTLGLHPMQLAHAPGLRNLLKCPTTYFRSSYVRIRPKDWPRYVQFYDGGSGAITEDTGDPKTAKDAEILFATKHFLTSLDDYKMRCVIFSNKAAAWKVKASNAQLSAVAVAVLRKQGLLKAEDVTLYRAREYDIEDRPRDPLSSLAANTYDTVSSVLHGAVAGPVEAYKQSQLEKRGRDDPDKLNSKDRPEVETDPYTSVGVSTARGVGHILGAGLKMPVTFTHGLAKGFHNVPRLYGDNTVRDDSKITGVGSGFSAAGKGLALGLYDGLTGIVTQPYEGAKKQGPKGFVKGFGKGLGGVVFKPAAGACGIPGYAFMGIYKELQKVGKTSEGDYIVAARLAQGEDEYGFVNEEGMRYVVETWQSLRASVNGMGRP